MKSISRAGSYLLLCMLLAACTGLPDRQPASATPQPVNCGTVVDRDTPDETPPEALVWDDFSPPDTNLLAAQTRSDVRYAFDNDAYLIDVSAPTLLVWSRLDRTFRDIRFEVESRMVAGTPDVVSGLIFRYQDDDNFYLFQIAYNGFYSLELVHHGQRRALIDWTPSTAITRSTGRAASAVRNVLRVDTRGDHITLFVNGTRLEETIDSTFLEGDIALAVNNVTSGEAAICFDNLLVVTNGE